MGVLWAQSGVAHPQVIEVVEGGQAERVLHHGAQVELLMGQQLVGR